jgi:glycine/sarcosine N-methyltransferase
MEARDFYEGLGGDYDRMIAWDRRLGREEAFFKGVFAEHFVRRVLDAACGTGMHAIAFSRMGVIAAGADLSPAMIAQAETNARAAGVDLDFKVAGFGSIAGRFAAPFDAVTCLGNSLPHLLDDASLGAALRDFAALLSPGGILVIQNRNYDRLLQQRQRFMPPASREDDSGETIYLRITDFSGAPAPDFSGAPAPDFSGAPAGGEETVGFTIVTLRKKDGAWSQSVQTTTLRALRRATMEKALEAAGFSSVTIFGGYDRAPYDASGAADLVALAVK